MSNDDGNCGMTSADDFRAKFNSLVLTTKLKLQDACIRVGVDYDSAVQAIAAGTYGLPENQNTLHRVLQAYGKGFSWLVSSTDEGDQNLAEVRTSVFALVYDYCFRAGVSKHERSRLIKYIMNIVDSKPTNTQSFAARTGVPRTSMDVARIHRQISRESDGRGAQP